MGAIVFFLLVFCFSVGVEGEPYNKVTNVSYEAVWRCNLGTFCAFGNYVEADTFWSDFIYHMPLFCSTDGIIRHKVNVTFRGADGEFFPWGTEAYEAALELAHNCSSSREVLYHYQYLREVPFKEKFIERDYDITLDNQGKVFTAFANKGGSSIELDWAKKKREIERYIRKGAPYVDENWNLY